MEVITMHRPGKARRHQDHDDRKDLVEFAHGDRVLYLRKRGTVDKYIPAQGSFHAACVVDWDDGSRTTVWASDLDREEENG
jgi:hypothetical protein